MKLRKNFLPRRLVDVFGFLLIGVFLPVVFIFEMIIVLPAFHEPGGFFHTITFALSIFLVFNIKGNMLACMLIDTSVQHKQLTPPPANEIQEQNWWHCNECNSSAPPRSWHCKICNACILKRDHHCLFTGCCIGHTNHRYFLLFVSFLFIGAMYAFVYNSLYLWVLNGSRYLNWFSFLKMFCPLLMLVSGLASHNIYLLFYNLNILALAYSIVLIAYHGPIIWRGAVCYERGKDISYNQGWHRNLEHIFGSRMHLVWLSPFVRSTLPHDGIDWNPLRVQENLESLKTNKFRNKIKRKTGIQ